MDETKQKKKGVALVLQGGGARCAFTAGVLDVFAENGLRFDAVFGTSGGALCAANFISGDVGRNKFVCTSLMTDKKFLSLKNLLIRKTAFNFTYLFFTVSKTISPFSEEVFFKDERPLFVATTSLESGGPAYFQKGGERSFYKALAASSSLPLLSKPVMIDGHPYLDGAPAAPIPFKKAVEEGYEKMVVVLTRERGFRKKKTKRKTYLMAKMLYRKYPKFLASFKKAADIYNGDMDYLHRLEGQGNALLVLPATPPEVKRTEKNKKRLLALYEEGRRIAMNQLEAIKRYMGPANE